MAQQIWFGITAGGWNPVPNHPSRTGFRGFRSALISLSQLTNFRINVALPETTSVCLGC